MDSFLQQIIDAKKHNNRYESRTICDWDFKAKQYFNLDFNYNSIYKVNCGNCNTIVTLISNDGGWCDKCMDYIPNDLFDDLESKAYNFDFEIEESKEIKLFKSVYKITMNNNDIMYYGVLECTISYEENEWSSSPHDDYFADYNVFNSVLDRDSFYDQTYKSSAK
jgi:hypothetical protein